MMLVTGKVSIFNLKCLIMPLRHTNNKKLLTFSRMPILSLCLAWTKLTRELVSLKQLKISQQIIYIGLYAEWKQQYHK